jgi:hypothetical protein
VGRDKQPCCGREQPWHRGSCSSQNVLAYQARRDACRANPDPVNMDGRDVVCWECGAPRKTSRDYLGHAYCPDHARLWTKAPAPTPRQLRDSANRPWEE